MEDHGNDWNNNVGKYVETYGETNTWETMDKYSFGRDIMMNAGHYDVWVVDVETGKNKEFYEILMEVKRTYESMGNRAFLVFNNPIHSSDNADVALLTSYTNMADWASDWKVKEAYEKLYGADSWGKMLNKWRDVTVDYYEELRSFVK